MTKKIVNHSAYNNQLGFLPEVLEPMLAKVKEDLYKQVPKGWLALRMEEVETDTHRWTVKIATTLYMVRAPRIITNMQKRTRKQCIPKER